MESDKEKTVYICGRLKFPKGSASAMYVQCLAGLFMESGHKVVLITNTSGEYKGSIDECEDLFVKKYKDRLAIDEVKAEKSGIRGKLDNEWATGRLFRKKLEKYDISKEDIIISYPGYDNAPEFNNSILTAAAGAGCISLICSVEWFSHSDFNGGMRDPHYWLYKYNFGRVVPRFDGVLAISRLLSEYYEKKGTKSLLIPIMSDPYEFGVGEKVHGDKRRFVYTGKGYIKENMDSVMQAVAMLSDDERRKTEFHLTGVKKDAMLSGFSDEEREKINECTVFHGWLDYSELVELYRSADFLILSREDTRMTRANFPSKVPEAMNYGVVPVVTRVGDYTDLYLNEHNSIIFDGCSAEVCAEAIRKAVRIETSDLVRLSENAVKTSKEKFSYFNWISVMEEFITGLREGRK